MTAPTPLVALLDQLDELRAKATPGPWEAAFHAPDDHPIVVADGYGFPAECPDLNGAADAALIVAAVNALPELIAELRKRDAAVRAVLELADEIDEHWAALIPDYEITDAIRTAIGGDGR